MKCSVVLMLPLAAISLGASALGATFTVMNTNDSGPGSLREAITNANAMAGADTIQFAIPGAGQKTITVLTDLPIITETVIIDGGNGAVASNRVEITSGGSIAIGLHLENASASNSTIRNLVINRFSSTQISFLFNITGSTIQGNFIGLNATGTAFVDGSGSGISFDAGSNGNTVGGADASARNVISSLGNVGVQINNSADDVIQGNFIGLNAAGTASAGNPGLGVFVSNGSAIIGGTNPGEGNVIVASSGIVFGGNPALGHSSGTAQGNFIGTDATGTTALNLAGAEGINVSHASGVVINGGNVISGNGTGISMSSSGISGATSDSTTVQGNFIGTAADGVTALGNTHDGVNIFISDNNKIGGTGSGEGNVIAFNGEAGVRSQIGVNNPIEGNLIFSNGTLGIDLDTVGVSLNDPGDSDTGANNLQNFPLINSVTTTSSDVTITGILSTRPSTDYRLEFFGSAAADPSGFGEGETFLGATDVTTDGVGGAAFTVNFPLSSSLGVFTATATDSDGSTSEFSHAFGIKLQNISTRLNVLTGENLLIGGFIINGEIAKEVIIRAIGPSLGIILSNVLADPILELHLPDQTVVTNDNWKDSQQAEIEATGFAPSSDLESAIVATLDPGAYTAVVSGKDGGTGVALVEVYDLDQTLGPILANISTRGFVDIGDNVMIGGFIVGPTGTGLLEVLIRAIGPSLSPFGVDNPLLDPLLELHNSDGAVIATNDNWKETQEMEIEATGLAPGNDSESAILQTLAPGSYTAIVKGVGDTTGVGLVEVYNLPNTL